MYKAINSDHIVVVAACSEMFENSIVWLLCFIFLYVGRVRLLDQPA